ncbi:MAG: hypothetical protein KIT43_00330 [Bauldia sp.]|nr:hypothetical protein [Bauldia sp.]MCW5718043.1 hypothetical protein [Bauldia sp.]
MNSARSLLISLAITASAVSPAVAQITIRPDIAALTNRVMLGCAIEVEKVFVVTNTTASTIIGGTPIFIEIVRIPDGARNVLFYHGGDLPPGGVFREGTYNASSCTAWIEVERFLAPSIPAPPAAEIGPLDRPVLIAP